MPSFEKSVFVNCPFDSQYVPLLEAMVFTIQYLGFEARTSYEISNSGDPRIQKLVKLIKGSKYGIHDLSRCRARKPGEYYRLNMPLELGIDYGCRQYGGGKLAKKKILVLEAQLYRYQKAISDLAGSDIKAHRNNQHGIVKAVRDWLTQEAAAHQCPPSVVKAKYDDFKAVHFEELVKKNYSLKDIAELPFDEVRKAMRQWIAKNRE